jgi:hypothetical protein
VVEYQDQENKVDSKYSASPLTPVTINGNIFTALVDSGANPSYISLEWVNRLELLVTPADTTTTVSRAGKMEKSLVTVAIDCGNGDNIFRNIRCTVIDITCDLIIGRNYFAWFGFILSGLPVKMPGPQITATDELVPPILP